MSTRALQFECLLNPVIDYRTNSVASGYTVYFYAAGTSTAKNVWTEKEKTNPYTERTLASDGTVQVYGDGVYRIVIEDADGVSVYDWDNVKVQANTYTPQTVADDYTVTPEDDLVQVDTTTGAVTIGIENVTGFSQPFVIKVITGPNNVTVDPYSTQTIDGNTTITLSPGDVATLYPDVTRETWSRTDRFTGLTASVAELNHLTGITASAEELNHLTGITASAEELNQLDAVSVGGNASGDIVTTDGIQTLTNKTVNGGTVNPDTLQIGGIAQPRRKIVEIGDWNMDADASKNVAHGLTLAKIRGFHAVIRNDDDTTYNQVNGYTADIDHGVMASVANATNIILARSASGAFDSVDYDSTSYNRGWIVIDYVD